MDSNLSRQLKKAARTASDDSIKLLNDSILARNDFDWLNYRLDKSGDSIFHVGARYGNAKLLRYLCERFGQHVDLELMNSDGKRPLHEAAQSCQISTLNYLISRNVAVDPLKKSDWTPLMLSCAKNNLAVIKTLIKAGANLHLKNKDGWTSFHIATREGHTEILEYLISYDASVTGTVSKNGRTPLHTAALHGKEDTVALLLRCFEPDTKDSCGSTPFMDALRADHVPTARLLATTQGVKVETVDSLGRGPLHVACQSNSLSAVRFLTEKLALPLSPTDNMGFTPLRLASQEGHLEIVKYLMKCEAEDCNNRPGKTISNFITD